jgi:predicted RNA-binding protein YlxR (DUF448 family)
MCCACREHAAKGVLVRVVRTPEGAAAVDPTGRAKGRGAYLHDLPECWEKARRRGILERALRISRLTPEDLDALRASGIPDNGGSPRHEHDSREDREADGPHSAEAQPSGGMPSANP